MASTSQPKVRNYKAGGVITNYTFVKFGADKDTVVQCGQNERAIGVYNGEADAVENDFVGVCLPGGGARLKVDETVGLGKMITSKSTGLGEVVDAAGEWVGALGYEDGVQSDIIAVEVVGFEAVASDA